jgi:hypothetical protein
MGDDFRLDLERGNIFASSPDNIFQPVHEEIVALFIHAKRVTGVKPTVPPHCCRRLRIFVVAVVHRPRTLRAHHQFADLAQVNFKIILVDDPNIDALALFSARPIHRRVRRGDNRQRDLGHVEDRIDIDPEPLGKGGHGKLRQGRRAPQIR